MIEFLLHKLWKIDSEIKKKVKSTLKFSHLKNTVDIQNLKWHTKKKITRF